MKLYDYFRSSAAYRVRIALNLKGLAPERRSSICARCAQREDDYLALNPQGLVPALVTDDGDVLTQSLAIIEYLDETFPKPPLLPADPAARARVRALALAIACDIHPLDNLRVLHYLTGTLGVDGGAEERLVQVLDRHRVRGAGNARSRAIPRPAASATAMRRRSPTSASCRRWRTRGASISTSRRIRR